MIYQTKTVIQMTPEQLGQLFDERLTKALANYAPPALVGPDLLTRKQAKSHHAQTPLKFHEGTVAIAFVQQADGSRKQRPVLLLRQMPGYGDFLVCGISTQLRQAVSGFDEVLMPNADNQLRATSVARLSNLVALSAADIDRAIGFIPAPLHAALLQRLSTYLAVI